MQELFPNVHQAVTTMSIGPMKFSAAMFAVKTEDELILIDAFELDDSETKELEALGTPTHTVITCVTHERDCDTYRKKYDAKIITHRDTVPKLEGSVDETFGDGETIVGGHYIMGWTLTIATYRAQTGATRGKRNRCSVQLILDWWSETGVDMILVRDVIAGDEKLPRHDADKDTAATVPKPCVAFPSVILWATNLPRGKGGMGDKPWGHRFGLRLAGDGTHLSWSLDGVEMGGAEISVHYFGDVAEAVRDSAYATIAAAGSYRESLWKVNDISILAST